MITYKEHKEKREKKVYRYRNRNKKMSHDNEPKIFSFSLPIFLGRKLYGNLVDF